MNINTKTIGNYGENLSCKFLLDKGYTILERNFRNRFGEIDIIAYKDNILSFIEVKTRYNLLYGCPKVSITPKKQKTIIYLSKFYLSKHQSFNYYIRYDVIEIFLNTTTDTYNINFIKDAFRIDF